MLNVLLVYYIAEHNIYFKDSINRSSATNIEPGDNCLSIDMNPSSTGVYPNETSNAQNSSQES